jgi:hypothetical protein
MESTRLARRFDLSAARRQFVLRSERHRAARRRIEPPETAMS